MSSKSPLDIKLSSKTEQMLTTTYKSLNEINAQLFDLTFHHFFFVRNL